MNGVFGEPLPLNIAQVLVSMAMASPQREICGFLKKDWTIVPIKNVADRNDRFVMDTEELLRFYRSSYEDILGVYHSHYNGQESPSSMDAAYAMAGKRYWIVTFSGVFEWRFGSGDCTRVASTTVSTPLAVALPGSPG